MLTDKVFATEISATAITGKDAWNRPTPQPITISVSLDTNFHKAAITDNLKHSLNYAVISRNVSEFMRSNEHKNFKSLGNIAEAVSTIVLDESKGGGEIANIIVKSKKSEIRADSIDYSINRSRSGIPLTSSKILDQINVTKLRLLTIIGVFTFERYKKQIVEIDLSFNLIKHADISIHDIIDDVVTYVETSNFKTVEALITKIGQLIFQKHGNGISYINIKVTKPNAISFTEGVGVSSRMDINSFKDVEPIKFENNSVPTPQPSDISFNLPLDTETNSQGWHEAFIAFGSNVGNQVQNITEALNLLNENGIKVVATSSLYVSKPMYHITQPDFLNGVIKVVFENKSPDDLLKVLKKIEYNHLKRVKLIENGPRSIDLDIILYDSISINTQDLVIPHKSMLERTFVMQPLCELIGPDFIHPVTAEPIHNHLNQLLKSSPESNLQDSSLLWQVNPLAHHNIELNPLKFDPLTNKNPTLIMGILNITPDSFSDGGKNFKQSTNEIINTVSKLLQDGATIIDIGGVSTRPGSTEPSEEEELNRVIPIIKAIRSSTDVKVSKCLISIDTYRAKVAQQSLEAGADIINDVSMGLYEPEIFDVVAKFGCPYIVNHTRGKPDTMSQLTNYESNTNDDITEYIIDPNVGHLEINQGPEIENLINGISRELALQLLKAFDRGVRKWQIILDPGIGFAKDIKQNLVILKNAKLFKKYAIRYDAKDENMIIKHSYLSFNGLPMLIGTSRKRFLGSITNQPDASKRIISTSASIIACIEQNTDIVRVHDVKQIKEACMIGDAIYRDIININN
ncbi:Dihydropteroate synthase-like protein [Scheffersomyces amazonensis]|uniref:Dihydropteroate synthase-like protein n=1 Tax=Scheffersomyces amazonensis TaxID=1078765 RepID=UPI00315CF842